MPNLESVHPLIEMIHVHDIGLPEQAVGGFPLGSGLVVEDRPFMYQSKSIAFNMIFVKFPFFFFTVCRS